MPKKFPLKISVLFAISWAALSQSPAFEVASVKPAPPPDGPGLHVGVDLDNGRLAMSNLSLRNIVARAYRLNEQQLVTPDWMSSTRFDVAAKLPSGSKRDQVPEMLQTLLADRFKLTFHKESKVISIYALVAAKGGPKLKPADGDSGLSATGTDKGVEIKGKATLPEFAERLSQRLDRPVRDMTGILGVYEVELSWTRDDSAVPTGDSSDLPPIFTAIQEKMGLKLEARKAPMDVIVVDHAEKIPTEN